MPGRAGLRRLSGGRGPSGGGARLGASWWTGCPRQAPSPVSRFRGFAVEESPSLVRGWGRLKLFNSLGFRSPGGLVMGRWLACGAFSSLALVRSCSLGRPCGAFPLKAEGWGGQDYPVWPSLRVRSVDLVGGLCLCRVRQGKDRAPRYKISSFNVAVLFWKPSVQPDR